MSGFFSSGSTASGRGQNKRRGSSFFSSATPSAGNKYDLDALSKSMDNAQRRIEDAGYKKEDTDKRNWFEKFTNLPQDQNFLFDTLDILSRPGYGIKNVIDKTFIDGSESQGKALWKGFSGQERVHGSQIVDKLGVDNKSMKFALGLGLDIATDPISYTPVGLIAKGAKGAAKLAAAPVKAGYKALESASPALKSLRQDKVQPMLESGKDALGYSLVPDYKLNENLYGQADDTIKSLKQQTENRIGFMTDESMKNISNTAKAAGGIDTGPAAARIMEKDLKQFEDVKGFEFPGGLKKTENKQDLIDVVKSNRDIIANLGKGINATGREFRSAISQTASELEKTERQIRRQYFSRENAALRQLNSRKNKPLNIDELAQSKAFEKVSVSPSFNLLLKRREVIKTSLNTLRTGMVQAKTSGINQINTLKESTNQFKESLKNPVMIKKQIERPTRELSADPAINQAAQNLMKSNVELREWAKSNQVDVPELEGYMRHILSKEERKRRGNVKALPIDRGNSGIGQPNKGVMKGREVPGSVEDINERMISKGKLNEGETFFEPNAFFATAVGQKQLIEYVNAVKFRKDVLTNPSFAKPLEEFKASGNQLPKNAVVINTNEYKFLSDDAAADLGIMDKIGGDYVVTKSVKQALDRYKKLTTDDGINAFLKTFDTVQSFWKRGALFSAPYHLRNIVGATFNNYVGGMNVADLAKYTAAAYPEAFNAYIKGTESPLFKEFREQGLGSTGQLKIEYARAGEDAEESIRRTIEKRSKLDGTLGTRLKVEAADLKNPLNAFETSRQFGDFNDQATRFAMYKYSKDRGMTPEQAAAKVREVQFDYSRTTPLEREVLTRVAPFYRWVRNNLPYQIRSFINDPKKYANVNKIRLNAQDTAGIEEDDVPDFMKAAFAVPVTGTDDGTGKFLSMNIPAGDLTKLTNPLKLITDSLTPLVKLPLELSTNTSFFTGKDIEKFEGQKKQYEVPSNLAGVPLPGAGTGMGGIDAKTAYTLESLLGQPGRSVSNFFTKAADEDQDKKFRDPGLGISSILKDYNVENSKYFEQYDEYQKMLALIKYIEQQTGEKPRTISEIKKGAQR